MGPCTLMVLSISTLPCLIHAHTTPQMSPHQLQACPGKPSQRGGHPVNTQQLLIQDRSLQKHSSKAGGRIV